MCRNPIQHGGYGNRHKLSLVADSLFGALACEASTDQLLVSDRIEQFVDIAKVFHFQLYHPTVAVRL